MGVTLILILGGLSMAFAVAFTGVGLIALARHRGRHAVTPAPIAIALEGKGEFAVEPGVLLNTLWEHLPDAACQSGECGGCKLRLLEGEVEWIREPVAQIDRHTHILACSCRPKSSLRCAAP